MIYDSNRKEKNLNKKLFKSPTAEYRGTPFWAWNCDLERDELLRQIDVFKEMGLGGFHMHVRTGMSTEYLSDEFMSLIKACTDHAKKNEMLAWLYDEDRWPSGSAGGIITKDHAMRQRYLRFTANVSSELNDRQELIAIYDIVLDENKCLKSYKILKDGESAEGTPWKVVREISADSPWFNGQAYVDTLDEDAMKKFIDVTYEAYNAKISDDFGKVVPAIFTDEPQFTQIKRMNFSKGETNAILAWTNSFDSSFKAPFWIIS